MYIVKSRSTGALVGNTVDVEEAMLMDAAQFTVEAHGRPDVLKLATLRCDTSPDYNRLPEEDEKWVTYTTKSGRKMICEVIRMFAPDSEGYPQFLELISKTRPDTSFPGAADRCEVLDLSKLSPELAKALISDETSPDEEPKLKLTKGLRRA